MQNLYSTKDSLLSRKDKEKLLNQKGICIWLTGLSGSGKTTIANYVSRQLHCNGVYTQVLDESDIKQRTMGMKRAFKWYRNANLMAVYKDHGVTEGMRKGIRVAKYYNIKIVYRSLSLQVDR